MDARQCPLEAALLGSTTRRLDVSDEAGGEQLVGPLGKRVAPQRHLAHLGREELGVGDLQEVPDASVRFLLRSHHLQRTGLLDEGVLELPDDDLQLLLQRMSGDETTDLPLGLSGDGSHLGLNRRHGAPAQRSEQPGTQRKRTPSPEPHSVQSLASRNELRQVGASTSVSSRKARPGPTGRS
jgi:hypothetical protein